MSNENQQAIMAIRDAAESLVRFPLQQLQENMNLVFLQMMDADPRAAEHDPVAYHSILANVKYLSAANTFVKSFVDTFTKQAQGEQNASNQTQEEGTNSETGNRSEESAQEDVPPRRGNIRRRQIRE